MYSFNKILYWAFVVSLFLAHSLVAQIQEDFSNGNFTEDPVWTGDEQYFTIDEDQLRNQGPSATANYFLSTVNQVMDEASWEFWFRLGFNASGSNFIRFYLVSDQADLNGPLQGYYLQFGNANANEFRFYRQNGTQSELLASGLNSYSNSEEVFRVKVSRSEQGLWAVEVDADGGNDYSIEVEPFVDDQILATSYFGLYLNTTATRRDLVWIDEIEVSGNFPAPQITEVIASHPNEMELSFSQVPQPSSALDPAAYELLPGGQTPVTVTQLGSQEYKLIFDEDLPNGQNYSLRVQSLQSDTHGAWPVLEQAFFLFYQSPVQYRDVLINEIMADPSPSQGLPEFKYIELFNRSEKVFQLEGWTLEDRSSTATLREHFLRPGEHLLLCANNHVEAFQPFSDQVMGLSNFPSPNITSDDLVLRQANGELIDAISYDRSWYNNVEREGKGFSLELIDPSIDCQSSFNWKAAQSPIGGSPGQMNSVYGILTKGSKSSFTSFYFSSPTHLHFIFDAPLSPLQSPGVAIDDLLFEAEIQPENPNQLRIQFDHPPDHSLAFSVVVMELEDCFSEHILPFSVDILYDQEPAELIQQHGLDSLQVLLRFNKQLAPLDVLELDQIVLDAQGKSIDFKEAFFLPGDSVLIVKFQESFPPLRDSLILNVPAWRSFFGQSNVTPYSATLHIPDHQAEGNIQDAHSLNLSFDFTPDPAGLVAEQFYLKDYGQADLVTRDSDRDSLIHLFFSEALPENQVLQLILFGLQENGEVRTIPAVELYWDREAPQVVGLQYIADDSLKVLFDKDIDRTSAESIHHYSLNRGIGRPSQAKLMENLREVHLHFDQAFLQESNHTLSVENIRDLLGNRMPTRRNVSFYFDIQGPILESLIPFSSRHIHLRFHEPLDSLSALQVEHFEIEPLGFPDSIYFISSDFQSLALEFKEPIPTRDELSLQIINLMDRYDNMIDENGPFTFSHAFPKMIQATPLSSSKIKLRFSRPIPETWPLDTSSLQLLPLKIESLERTDNEYELILHSLEEMELHQAYQVKAHQVELEGQEVMKEHLLSFTFQNYLNHIQLLSSRRLRLDFSIALKESSLLTQHFVLLDTLTPSLIHFDPSRPKSLSLTFEKAIPESESYILVQNLRGQEGTIIPDFLAEIKVNFGPPTLEEVEVLSPSELQLTFNKPLDPFSALAPNHYELDGNIFPVHVDWTDGQPQKVFLIFPLNFEEGKDYELSIRSLEDQLGIKMEAISYVFSYQVPFQASFRDIVISELMNLPEGALALPEHQYLEIFNRSEHSFDLQNYQLEDRTRAATFPSMSLEPGEYLVLCHPSHAPSFQAFGKVLGIPNFPNLNRTQDDIRLSNARGVLVDEINYRQAWFSSQAEGRSLELIHPFKRCSGSFNWAPSQDERGGTPGTPNSVLDTLTKPSAPILLAWELSNNKELRLHFSANLDSTSLTEQSFTFHPSLEISDLAFHGAILNEISLHLAQSPEEGKVYTLQLQNISDCHGISLKDTSFQWAEGKIPEFHDLLVTEIYSNPEPSRGLPSFEFVEVYNPTEKAMDLADLSLGNGRTIRPLPRHTLMPGEYLILCPNAAVESYKIFGNALGVSNWPGFNISGDHVRLINSAGEIIFEVEYHRSWYRNSEKEAGGWTLEMIDLSNPCGERENWKGSENVQGGSPGKLNSVNDALAPPAPPQLTKAVARNPKEIALYTDKKIKPHSVDRLDIQIQPSVGIDSIKMEPGKRVELHLRDPLQSNQRYEVKVRGLANCNGKSLHDFQKIDLVLPVEADSGDLVINEVLFNPGPGGAEFVELFNRSDRFINLKGWSLANANEEGVQQIRPISEQDDILAPGSYIVFTRDPEWIMGRYAKVQKEQLLEVPSMPSYPNTQGRVVLLNPENVVMDYFEYHENMHFRLLRDVRGVSLEKVSVEFSSDHPDNWKSAAELAGFATPGYENSQSRELQSPKDLLLVEPRVISPDGSGQSGFATITFKLDGFDHVINAKIYDAQGRLIKELAKNASISSGNFLTWDGSASDGRMVRSGLYLLQVELYNLQGEQQVLMESIAVGSRFR